MSCVYEAPRLKILKAGYKKYIICSCIADIEKHFSYELTVLSEMNSINSLILSDIVAWGVTYDIYFCIIFHIGNYIFKASISFVCSSQSGVPRKSNFEELKNN